MYPGCEELRRQHSRWKEREQFEQRHRTEKVCPVVSRMVRRGWGGAMNTNVSLYPKRLVYKHTDIP